MKIELRKVKLSDADDLRKCVNNKKVIPYLDHSRKYPISLAYARKSIQKSIKDKVNCKRAIIVDGKFVGTIGLYNPDKTKNIFEIGYFIAEPYWGRGIATYSVKKMTELGFKKLKLKRIWAITSAYNPASSRVLEKAGYKLEGTMKKSIYKKGKCFNQSIYAIIK